MYPDFLQRMDNGKDFTKETTLHLAEFNIPEKNQSDKVSPYHN